MDKKEQEIRNRLKAIAAQHGPDIFKDGTVVLVDDQNYFVDVELDTGETLFECRLRAQVAGNQSIDVLPVVGSAVVVAKIIDDEYIVIAIDEISSYRTTVGNMVLKIDSNGIQISNGEDSFKSILNDLIMQVQGIAAYKDNAAIEVIRERVNALFQ